MQETERTIKTVIARSGDGHAYNQGEVVYERLVQLQGFDWEKFSVFDLWPLKGGGILREVVVLGVSSKFKCQKRGQKGAILRPVYPAADCFNIQPNVTKVDLSFKTGTKV